MTHSKQSEHQNAGADLYAPYVERINAAVAYKGNNDHEDVVSILKAFGRAYAQDRVNQVLAEILEKEEKLWAEMDNGEHWAIRCVRRSVIESYMKGKS